MVQAAEAAHALAQDRALTGTEIRGKLGKPGEGVGVVEAARGTLFHRYALDENGLVRDLDLIVATTHNAAGIGLSVKQMAEEVVGKGPSTRPFSTRSRWRSGPTILVLRAQPTSSPGRPPRGGDLRRGGKA